MIEHKCAESGCLYCMVSGLYEEINLLRKVNDQLTCIILTERKERSMDAKIKKIMSKEKGAVKETKELLKMDKKQDKKVMKCDKEMMKKKKK